jgi:hypothetical protein
MHLTRELAINCETPRVCIHSVQPRANPLLTRTEAGNATARTGGVFPTSAAGRLATRCHSLPR